MEYANFKEVDNFKLNIPMDFQRKSGRIRFKVKTSAMELLLVDFALVLSSICE